MFGLLFALLTMLSSMDRAYAKVSTSEVTYKISTNTHRNENFVTPIDASKIKNQVPIIFIIHGWTNYGTKPWIQNLTTALLTHSDCNVVAVDWRKPANDSYPIAVKNVKEVGEIIGDAIKTLIEKYEIPLTYFHLIGHSLGAHVAGRAAQRVKAKLGSSIPWITGLDPAGPLYEAPVLVPKNERLSDDDATAVEIVHTDGGLLGFHGSIGTIDFFPNGGEYIQPNCSSSVTKNFEKLENYVFCSHEKSSQYYTIAIEQNGYQATKCSSWEAYKVGACKNNEKATFGSLKMPKQKGNYYFKITGPVLEVV